RSCALAKRTSWAMLLCFASCAFARDEYTRVFEQTYPLAQGQSVRVQHKLGDVVIRTHAKPEVVVRANIRVMLAWGAGGAKKFAENIEIDVHQFANALMIETRYPKGGFFRITSYVVNFEITVPETAPLEVHNGFGAVEVSDLKANADLNNSF